MWHYDEKKVGEETLKVELINNEIVSIPLYNRGYLIRSLNKHRPDQNLQRLQTKMMLDKVKRTFKK